MTVPATVSVQGQHASDPSSSKSCDRDLDKRLKLQNFLVMKAFILRKGKQTLTQQFQFLRRTDEVSGKGFLEIETLCDFLCIPPFRKMILCQIFGLPIDAPHATRIDFDSFLRFLQTAVVQAAHEEKELRRQDSPRSLPVPPPSIRSTPNNQVQASNHALVCFEPSLLSMQFSRPPPAPGLWKKREITIQERITEYTKIDEHGRAQHLVEQEKHQSEVIHMESLLGEFAHREITHYEQLEKLNDEIVHHETGREEFVHLKSQHDEVSKFESSIPTPQQASRSEECEQPPPSPTIKRDPSTMDGDGMRSFQTPDRCAEIPEEEYYRYQQLRGGDMGEIPQEHCEIEGLIFE